MKSLSREGIQRMVGGISVSSSTSSSEIGGGGNGVTTAWVDTNYLSKDFFNQLFLVHIKTRVLVKDGDIVVSDTTTESTLEPNGIIPESDTETDPDTGRTTTTTVTIDSIEAKSNFWSSLAISALGQNSGGGGGGATALSGLVDVQLTNPTNGQALIYNSTLGKWVNGNVQSGGGTVTSITAGTGLSGGTITGSGTIAISSTYQSYISHGETAYGWGNHADAGYATQQWVTNKNYLTGITSSMVTSALGFTPLSDQTTFWGQSVSNGVVVGNIEMNNNDSIQFKDSGGYKKNVLQLNQSNILLIGYDTNNAEYATQLRGAGIAFYTFNNNAEVNVGEFSKSGRFWVKQGTQGLRIGDGLITWDSGNNALKIQRISSGSVVDGGLYATSFISALGANSSGGGGGSADGGLATSYTLPYTTSETYRYWHKLGTYQMDTASMCLIIDLFTGDGYNGDAYRNSWARIMIKKGSSNTISSSVGITCSQYGYQISNGKILVRINATAYNTGEVWVKCPWGWPKGAYTVQGNFTAWTHNNSTSGDTTSAPTHNQNAVGYYDNTSTMTTGE